MTYLAEAILINLGGILVLAGASKLLSLRRSASQLWLPLGIPPRAAESITALSSLAELFLGATLALQWVSPSLLIPVLCLTIAILTSYGHVAILRTGSCGCFGSGGVGRGGVRKLYGRNAAILVAGSLALLAMRGARTMSISGSILAVALPWLSLVTLWAMAFLLRSSYLGRELVRSTRAFFYGRRAIA